MSVGTALTRVIVAAVVFALLDAVWLGGIMSGFYRAELAAVARLGAGGALQPLWPAAVLVYALMAVGVAFFVLPRARSAASAAGWGAVFGAVLFGVYDLTNFSTLRDYSLTLALADIAWGLVTSAATSAATFVISKRA